MHLLSSAFWIINFLLIDASSAFLFNYSEYISHDKDKRLRYLTDFISQSSEKALLHLPTILTEPQFPISSDYVKLELGEEESEKIVSLFWSDQNVHPVIFPFEFVQRNRFIRKLISGEALLEYNPGVVTLNRDFLDDQTWSLDEKCIILKKLSKKRELIGSLNFFDISSELLTNGVEAWPLPNMMNIRESLANYSRELVLVDGLFFMDKDLGSPQSLNGLPAVVLISHLDLTSKFEESLLYLIIEKVEALEASVNLMVERLKAFSWKSASHFALAHGKLVLSLLNDVALSNSHKVALSTIIDVFVSSHDPQAIPAFIVKDIFIFICKAKLYQVKKINKVAEMVKSIDLELYLAAPSEILGYDLSQHIGRWKLFMFKNYSGFELSGELKSINHLIQYWGSEKVGASKVFPIPLEGKMRLSIKKRDMHYRSMSDLLKMVTSLIQENDLVILNGDATIRLKPTAENLGDLERPLYVAIARTIAANVLYQEKIGIRLAKTTLNRIFGPRGKWPMKPHVQVIRGCLERSGLFEYVPRKFLLSLVN